MNARAEIALLLNNINKITINSHTGGLETRGKGEERKRSSICVSLLFYFHKFGSLKLLEMKRQIDNRAYLLLIMLIICILSSSGAYKL